MVSGVIKQGGNGNIPLEMEVSIGKHMKIPLIDKWSIFQPCLIAGGYCMFNHFLNMYPIIRSHPMKSPTTIKSMGFQSSPCHPGVKDFERRSPKLFKEQNRPRESIQLGSARYKSWLWQQSIIYPLVISHIYDRTMANYSEFSHSRWWFSIAM